MAKVWLALTVATIFSFAYSFSAYDIASDLEAQAGKSSRTLKTNEVIGRGEESRIALQASTAYLARKNSAEIA